MRTPKRKDASRHALAKLRVNMLEGDESGCLQKSFIFRVKIINTLYSKKGGGGAYFHLENTEMH